MNSYPTNKIILYVYEENCPHCMMFEPQWSEFIEEEISDVTDYDYYKMDANLGDNIQATEEYMIMSFPGVVKLQGGKMLTYMDPGMADMPMMGYSW